MLLEDIMFAGVFVLIIGALGAIVGEVTGVTDWLIGKV